MSQPDIRGSIARGKKADSVLVDRDTLTVSPEELKDTKVIWTMGNAKIVYRSKSKADLAKNWHSLLMVGPA